METDSSYESEICLAQLAYNVHANIAKISLTTSRPIMVVVVNVTLSLSRSIANINPLSDSPSDEPSGWSSTWNTGFLCGCQRRSRSVGAPLLFPCELNKPLSSTWRHHRDPAHRQKTRTVTWSNSAAPNCSLDTSCFFWLTPLASPGSQLLTSASLSNRQQLCRKGCPADVVIT